MGSRFKPVGMEIGQTLSSLIRLVKRRLPEAGGDRLTLDQFAMLYTISEHKDDMIQQDMAEMLGKDKSAILRLIDSLEEKSLLRRVPDEADRRKKKVEITDEGQHMLCALNKIEKEIHTQVFEGLSEPDIATFYKVLYSIRNKSELL